MMNVKNSKTLCVLPWLMRYIHNDGRFYLCCISASDPDNALKDDSGKPLFVQNVKHLNLLDDCQRLQTIKKLLSQNQWPDECRKCREHEARGSLSHRLLKNKEFAKSIDSIESGTSNIEILDLRLGNFCNLRCVMCGPDASHLWVDKWNQLQPKSLEMNKYQLDSFKFQPWPTQNEVWQKIKQDSQHLVSIELAGGEPLLSNEAKSFLTSLIQDGHAQNIDLNIVTNLTVLTEDWLKIWSHFKRVSLRISLDGVGEYQELMRPGLRWESFEKNIKKLDLIYLQFPFSEVNINFTLQALNAKQLVPVMKWLQEFEHIAPLPHVSILSEPEYMDSRWLSESIKTDLIKLWNRELDSIVSGPQFDQIKNQWLIDSFERASGWLKGPAPKAAQAHAWSQRLLKDKELHSQLKKCDLELLLFLLSL